MQKLNRLSEVLKNQFATSKITTHGESLKLHVKNINSLDLIVLSNIICDMACDIELKRSGTGITILVKI